MRVEITQNAQDGLDAIYDYVYQAFGQEAFLRLEAKVDDTLTRLAHKPYTFEAIERRENDRVRRAIIQQYTILIYEVDPMNEVVRILSAFDARSDWK